MVKRGPRPWAQWVAIERYTARSDSTLTVAADKEASFKLLDAFYEAGGNFIDTANNYQNEESEEWIGDWMKERGNRDNMVIATKYTAHYCSYRVGKGITVNHYGNSRRSLHVSIRDSLKKLKTDWIDILYLHLWDWTTSIEEVMDSLDDLVKQGKVLYLGISDTPAWIVAAANTYARANNKTPFSVYQGRWNILERDFEHEIIPMARHFGMALCPWDVLGGGKFQSKKAVEARKAKGESLRASVFGAEQTPEQVKISEALEKVAEEHGVESVTTIALAYVMQKTPYVFPMIGGEFNLFCLTSNEKATDSIALGRKVEHMLENIKALSIHLTDKQIEYLEGVLPFKLTFPMNLIGLDPHVTGQSTGLTACAAPMLWQKDGRPIGHE